MPRTGALFQLLLQPVMHTWPARPMLAKLSTLASSKMVWHSIMVHAMQQPCGKDQACPGLPDVLCIFGASNPVSEWPPTFGHWHRHGQSGQTHSVGPAGALLGY